MQSSRRPSCPDARFAPTFLALALGFAAAVLLPACSGGGGGDDDPPRPPAPRTSTVSFTRDVLPIFRTSCAVSGCHVGGGTAPMSLEDNDAYENLVNVDATTAAGKRVAPGNSGASVLWARVSTDAMPPGALPKLSAAEKSALRGWIDQGAQQDLDLNLTGMAPHVGQYTEFRVVRKNAGASSGLLDALLVVDPLPASAFSAFLPAAVPPGEHDLEFFADMNGDGTYDAPPTDHAWRESLSSTGVVDFAHDTSFTDIGATAPIENLDFTLRFTAMTPHVGQLLECRLIDIGTGQIVGAYRLGAVPGAAFNLVLRGVVVEGRSYQADFFADLNGNGSYDPPTADHAWRLTGTAGAAGLTLDFAHNTTFTEVGF